MAHSLGNMVVSSMIQDRGLVPARYLMCNSAVPAEAYDPDPSLRVPQLVHPDWEEYPTNSWAASWHSLFDSFPNDDRRLLGWPGRFADVAQYVVEINGVTDTNGCFVIEGITTGNEIEITLTKPGHYSSTRRLCYVKMGDEREVKDGCWQPWGMEECMVIRKIEDPINIRNFCGFIDVPATNRWMGLDLREGCWVKPYGKGLVADIEVLVVWDGLPKPLSKTCMVRVRSVGNDGGCFFPRIKDSAFPNVKKASPCTVYEPILFDCVERVNGVRMLEGSRWETQSLVMRTRCVEDDVMDRIVTCNYLNLYKLKVSPSRRGNAVVNIEYVFNSKPNDNNLEDVRISQMQEEQFKRYNYSHYPPAP